MIKKIVLASLLSAATFGSSIALAQTNSRPSAGGAPLVLDATPMPLAGTLNPQHWASYRQRFVTDTGRVIDTANGNISHSEGQGYGMLLAVAARDRASFERIWNWTRANLMVRDDQLVAWRWEPNARPAVADMNNASDGDILIAWALAEAAELWSDTSYKVAGRRIAVELGRKVIVNKTRFGPMLLPGITGFAAEHRKDGPVINISYWVFPAFSRLNLVAPEFNWAGVTQSGLDLLAASRFGTMGLPTEWVSAAGAEMRPADGFPAQFSYNAIRIPLYMAWAGVGGREHYAPFVNAWSNGSLAAIEVASGRKVQPMSESGYASLAALTQCAATGAPLPRDFASPSPTENYYPATLHLMALVAAQMRYRSCMRTQ
ncbi:minor endoglucanase Y precursor [Variibacter gotjawalensis]|uniref:cellulase n=1 Tax=Variibacter gotjawalensis TaxID=1333996 RepID=A0A0S3PUG3_9BRAD|nr:glycosyl hydrolase family 8 [Variibacter gotjawalensis]NIK49927.1 endoglucanase [Variibacter gotjawalensis]RZS45926.1 endoglucanase [Variibacter gotjawalensis]BAT59601.1 minor endoglucanase Y precursor [Variibacter gotjawalensis]